MALNLLQQAKWQEAQLQRTSIKGLRKMCGWHEKTLDLIISKKLHEMALPWRRMYVDHGSHFKLHYDLI